MAEDLVLDHLSFIPNCAVTVVNGPVMLIVYWALWSGSDFVARL